MPFIDIAFQAEISRYEDPEFEEYAERNCNEDPKTRDKAVEEFRRIIYERGECKPRRIDDAYLLRFLRCRRFIPAAAHRLLVRYEDFRSKHAYLYNCNAFGLQKVKDIFGFTIPDSPDNGRIFILKLGRWNPEELSPDDVVRCALLIDEIAVMQPKIQILGSTLIIDLAGMSLKKARYVNATLADQIVSITGLAFPLHLHAVHIIHYSWLLNSFVYLFKHLVPDNVWGKIHFHGSDVTSLHKFIDPEYLPKEYGGSCQHFCTADEWLSKINIYKDDFMVNELRSLGFSVEHEFAQINI